MAASFQELLNTGVIGGGQGNQGPAAQTGGAAGGVVAALTGGKLPEVNTLERLSTQGIFGSNINGLGAAFHKRQPTGIDKLLGKLHEDFQQMKQNSAGLISGGGLVGAGAASANYPDMLHGSQAGQITPGAAVKALSAANDHHDDHRGVA